MEKLIYKLPLEKAKKLVSYKITDREGNVRPISHEGRGIKGKDRLKSIMDAIQSGEKMDPIEVGRSLSRKPEGGKIGDPAILDGHHRLMAHIELKKPYILARMPKDLARSLSLEESAPSIIGGLLESVADNGSMCVSPTKKLVSPKVVGKNEEEKEKDQKKKANYLGV